MDFSFISDEHFRRSLVDDQRELTDCLRSQAWKSVYVLAGSIVEALLSEYLVVSNIRSNGKDPLAMTLTELVQACHKAGVLQKSTASLCEAVNDYRNLIHPGRMKRLEQQVTCEGANIASNLVTIVAREVAEKRKATYGPTADQILKKLLADEHALAVLPQLLTETNEHERIKLVSSLLPSACLAEDSNDFSDETDLLRLRDAYRTVLNTVSVVEQGTIAAKFARMIREDSDHNIDTYSRLFFLSDDIRLLAAQDSQITLDYLINRIEQAGLINVGFYRTLAGITNLVDREGLDKFADALIRLVLRQPDSTVSWALRFVSSEFDALSDEKQAVLTSRIEQAIEAARGRVIPAETQTRLTRIENAWFEIPF